EHRGVLLDLELPARALWRQLRQLLDQAGGGRGFARIPAAFDLRDALACPRLCAVALPRAAEQQSDAAARRPRGACRPRQAELVAGWRGRASEGADAARGGDLLPHRAQPQWRRARPGRALPSRQWRAAAATQSTRRFVRERPRPVAKPDAQLLIRNPT